MINPLPLTVFESFRISVEFPSSDSRTVSQNPALVGNVLIFWPLVSLDFPATLQTMMCS